MRGSVRDRSLCFVNFQSTSFFYLTPSTLTTVRSKAILPLDKIPGYAQIEEDFLDLHG